MFSVLMPCENTPKNNLKNEAALTNFPFKWEYTCLLSVAAYCPDVCWPSGQTDYQNS